jgi:hypothetical protein
MVLAAKPLSTAKDFIEYPFSMRNSRNLCPTDTGLKPLDANDVIFFLELPLITFYDFKIQHTKL